MYYGKQGNSSIQDALERAASDAREDAHEVLSVAMLKFLQSMQLQEKPNWYLQAIRNLPSTLLANPVCNTNIMELSDFMKEVNCIQRGKS